MSYRRVVRTLRLLSLALVVSGAVLSGCQSSLTGITNARVGDVVTTQSGLTYTELVLGTGRVPVRGDWAVIEYSVWLEATGTLIDSSWVREEPFQFVMGSRQVIPGLEEGVASMRVGGKRRLVVPPELGYGEQGIEPIIPPHSTLIFEVDLVALR